MSHHPHQFRFGNGAPAWTEHEKLTLLRLHEDKVSRADIAKRLGKTKNAIIGQLDRLLRQGRPVRRDKPGGNNNPTGWNGKTTRKPAAPLKPKDLHRHAPQLPAPTPITPTISITAAERHHCRYIAHVPEVVTADTLIFCGQPHQAGTSYCPEHARLLLQPPRPRFA